MELVKLTNTGSFPITFQGNEPVVLAAGVSRLVPWQFAVDQLGDPFRDNPAEREVEYGLIRHWWGYHDGFDTAEEWEEKRPKVVVETLEGERIHMLIEDPLRRQINPRFEGNTMPPASDAEVLKAALAEQQSKMERLEAQLAALLAGATTDIDPTAQTADSAATENSLATVASGTSAAPANDGSELPTPKPTPKNASDSPKK